MTGAGWSQSVGISPRAVLVFEHAARSGTLYLRWWDPTRRTRAGTLAPNWQLRSLRRALTDDRGRPLAGKARKDVQAWALEQGMAKYRELSGHTAPGVAPDATPPLTILGGLARATDPATGRYLVDTPYRRDLVAAVGHAATAWDNRPWNAIDLTAWETFWRARIRAVQQQGKVGLSAARHGVERVHAVAAWLRNRRLIDLTAAVLPSDWRDEIARDYGQITGQDVPETARPRYTLDEARALLAVAPSVDPRLALLLVLGAELRAGQVLRAMRSDLDLDAGTFTVRGRGKKRGVTLELTPGQRAAVRDALDDGYLRAREIAHVGNRADYALFPGGALTRRSGWREGRGSAAITPLAPTRSGTLMSHSTASGLLRRAEAAAKISHGTGRGFHGLRRAYVDGAAGLDLSAEGLMQLGGWTDERTPKPVYRDREIVQGRTEARDARATLRGEAPE